MGTRKFLNLAFSVMMMAALLLGGIIPARAQTVQPPEDGSAPMQMGATPPPPGNGGMPPMNQMKRTTPADRVAAAARFKAALAAGAHIPELIPQPGGTPDYFGIYPNYANSQFPELDALGKVIPGTGIRKFIDTLPGLGAANANDLGQYIPVAIPDTTKYPGSDYYEIELREYTEKLHKDLPPTKLRGYIQVNTTDPTVKVISYLGPVIIAQRDRPVRIKFTNKLPTGSGGDLFIPVDTTDMGAGMGPNGGTEMYTQNRATLHLHGGLTPWISDGTPHQWTTPAGENTSYPEGVSVSNVPDMPDPGAGSLTFFYSNQQSARLMFYHDHSYGITRLNVYAGEAAGYLLQDLVEKGLTDNGVLPADQLPLIIQDKTFVPKQAQLDLEDPTWDTAKYGGQGNLWFPHVYMPNQNPWDMGGAAAMGRWDYGPWFWPPYTGLVNGPVDNPYYTPGGAEPPKIPGTPNPSLVPEGFMDTPLVNGTPYPSLTVQPKPYRFRILNASNDRFWNLQLYTAASNNPMWNPDGTLNDANAGEVPMVPAVKTPGFPDTWPTDGREGGVPDPAARGPEMIQIGTEGGFLPNPVVLPNQPIDYVYNRRDIVVLNVSSKTLFLGPAERADVIVDFSKYAGKTLILYNDAPAPVPAFDPRNDYYTGDPDHSFQTGDGTGGAPSTLPGYGPNTRTIMQIKVASANPAGDALLGVTVTRPGADYTTMPAVSFSGGGGSGAAATASGGVGDIAVLTPGADYTSVPTVTITGGGAITNAVATAAIKNGVVTGITVLDPGAGYTSAPSVTISGGGATTDATAAATLDVSAIALTNPGAGYTSAPEISLLGGGGYGAQAVADLAMGTPYSPTTPLDVALPAAFAASQDPIIVPQAAYNAAYKANFPADGFARIQDTSMTFTPITATSPITISMGPKAIQELFETQYGRMNAILGVEIPNTNAAIQTTIPYGYIDPTTEVITDSLTPLSPVLGDGTQIWKITHNGVDTHAIHFHLFNVQLINRVGWDGAVRPPDDNELGWKETVRMNPLEDAIVAMRPVAPKMPFGVPESVRPLDVTSPIGSLTGFTNIDPNGRPIIVSNQLVNYGWEYVWHCHLLGHEENDMMRPMIFKVYTVVPPTVDPLAANTTGSTSTAPRVNLQWTDPTPPTPANLGNPANEILFRIYRATGTTGAFIDLNSALANKTTYTDLSVGSNQLYRYRVVAYTAAGSSTSQTISITTPAGTKPVAPIPLKATGQPGPKVVLTWPANTVNVTAYQLSRTGGTTPFNPVTLPATSSIYTDTNNVVFGTTYKYSLVAQNGGLSSTAAIASILVVVPPMAPTNLRVTTTSINSISLAWNDNQVAPPETGYEIWVSPNGTSGWIVAGTVGTNVTTFTHPGLARTTTYFYRVRAYLTYTPTLYSAWSNTVSGRTR